ncbi:hypothetical protein QP027_11110 [Corynebacterium breve]|uniref:Tetratricopeptide repeat protein n=1 Tax=Corynebacterium breve TaxID=3049799 RepID=A0ABY8VE55_9CORY|nr:hypothetical protein [Corynebacterium breve]WIM67617.1 hypothetical protein QP027_11110 [Corynebacterium breve]
MFSRRTDENVARLLATVDQSIKDPRVLAGEAIQNNHPSDLVTALVWSCFDAYRNGELELLKARTSRAYALASTVRDNARVSLFSTALDSIVETVAYVDPAIAEFSWEIAKKVAQHAKLGDWPQDFWATVTAAAQKSLREGNEVSLLNAADTIKRTIPVRDSELGNYLAFSWTEAEASLRVHKNTAVAEQVLEWVLSEHLDFPAKLPPAMTSVVYRKLVELKLPAEIFENIGIARPGLLYEEAARYLKPHKRTDAAAAYIHAGELYQVAGESDRAIDAFFSGCIIYKNIDLVSENVAGAFSKAIALLTDQLIYLGRRMEAGEVLNDALVHFSRSGIPNYSEQGWYQALVDKQRAIT